MQERVRGTIERYHLQEPRFFPGNEDPTYYTRDDQEFKSNSIHRDFVDRNELAREKMLLDNEVDMALARGAQIGIGMRTQGELNRWLTVEKRVADLLAIGEISNRVLKEVTQGNPAGKTFLEVLVTEHTELGTQLVFRQAMLDRLALSRKHGLEEALAHETDLYLFANAFLVEAKIDGVALKDFADPKIAKKSSVPYFQYLMIAETIAYRDVYDEILHDNAGSLADEYPNIAKMSLNFLASKVSMLMAGVKPDILRSIAKGQPQPIREIQESSAQLLEGTLVVRDKARKALFNPKDPDSDAIRKIVEVYLNSPVKAERLHLFQVLGFTRFTELIQAYRRSYQLSSGENGEFYFDLAAKLREFVDDIASVKDILTDEDMDSFIRSSDEAETSHVDIDAQLQGQGRSINELTSLTSQRFFEINPADIEFGGLVRPELLEITFDKSRPRKFAVKLLYNNEFDEETEIEFQADTSKGTYDWSFLEDPMHPESAKVATMREQLVSLNSRILAEIAAQERQKKQQQATEVTPTENQERRIKERNEDPIYALRKLVRAEQRAQTKDEETIDMAPAFQEAKSQVKNVILVTDEDKEKRFHVGSEEKQQALAAIQDYNDRGVGKFTRKRKPGKDGKPRYTLHSGRLRVLLTEAESGDHIRNFPIEDVRQRGSIYEENDL